MDEEVMEWLYNHGKTAPYGIKTTEAPHYRRVVTQAKKAEASNLIEHRYYRSYFFNSSVSCLERFAFPSAKF